MIFQRWIYTLKARLSARKIERLDIPIGKRRDLTQRLFGSLPTPPVHILGSGSIGLFLAAAIRSVRENSDHMSPMLLILG